MHSQDLRNQSNIFSIINYKISQFYSGFFRNLIFDNCPDVRFRPLWVTRFDSFNPQGQRRSDDNYLIK